MVERTAGLCLWTLAAGTLLGGCGDAMVPGFSTEEQRTRVALRGIESAVSLHVAERGAPPASLDLLVSTARQEEPYLSRLPRDAWGRPFEIELIADSGWRVLSAGRDGVVGTPDDLTVEGRPEKGR